MKIEAVSSRADTKRASFRENHWTHQQFFSPLLSPGCLLLCASQASWVVKHQPAISCSIMASPAYWKRFQLPVLVCVVLIMEILQ